VPFVRKRSVQVAVAAVFVMVAATTPVTAQTFQFLPEVDVYAWIHRNIRFTFQAKETREAGDPTQAELGYSFDFFVKPLVRLKRVTMFDLDNAKSRPLQLSAGIRYLPSPDKPHIERLELAATSHYPLVAGILLTDRNRFDLDWSQNQLNWRYRNRVTLERRLTFSNYHPAPYVSAEVFYLSRYEKWSTTALYAGCLFPVTKHVQLDPYYEHQNVTSGKPNRQFNQLGVILGLYF
jgi:hypothetical protein